MDAIHPEHNDSPNTAISDLGYEGYVKNAEGYVEFVVCRGTVHRVGGYPYDIEAVTAGDMLACPHADVVDEPPTVPEGEEMWRDLAEHDGQVAEIVRRAAMLKRREYSIPSDLLPQETPFSDRERHMSMQSASDARDEALEARFEEEEVPAAVRGWTDTKREKVERMLDALRAVRDTESTSQNSLAEHCGVSEGSVSNYLANKNDCAECVRKPGRYDPYELTNVGRRVLDVDWKYVLYGERED